jgi:hypothetical protein
MPAATYLIPTRHQVIVYFCSSFELGRFTELRRRPDRFASFIPSHRAGKGEQCKESLPTISLRYCFILVSLWRVVDCYSQ